MLPMQPFVPEKRTHDYVRHGTTTLFAALDIATGKVTGLCQPDFGLSTANTVLNIPILLQEMALAVWLLVKGFTPSGADGNVGSIRSTDADRLTGRVG